MNLESLLLGLVLAVASAEYSSLLDWAARHLIQWAARLAYGERPRADIRLREWGGDLARCPGQVAKFLYAFWLVCQGAVARLWQVSGRPGATSWAGAGPGQIFAAVMAISETIQGFGGDLRPLPSARRKEFDRRAARLAVMLHEAVAVADDRAAEVLALTTGSVCRMYYEDRDERAVLRLVRDADALIVRLGRRHPALFGLRLWHAASLLTRGDHEQARTLLCGLLDDETAVYGSRYDARSFLTWQHYHWAERSAGRLREAEAGLLENESARILGVDSADLLHNQCKRAWTLGEQHHVHESAVCYDQVIAGRTRVLGADHSDTLDARHSEGKMLVINREYQAAYVVLRPLVPDMRRVLGARHPYTLESRKYLALARALMRPGDRRANRRASRELRRVHRAQIRRHGPDYPDTCDTQRWLATLTDRTEQP
jgi:hypothetical protein